MAVYRASHTGSTNSRKRFLLPLLKGKKCEELIVATREFCGLFVSVAGLRMRTKNDNIEILVTSAKMSGCLAGSQSRECLRRPIREDSSRR